MLEFVNHQAAGLILALVTCAAVSCENQGPVHSGKAQAQLHLRFSGETVPSLRSSAQTIDTNAFHLTVTDETGRTAYDGTYGNAPEYLSLEEGTYTVKAVSCDFRRPAFSMPEFGDEQCVVLNAGEKMNVLLECVQLNAGVRLKVDRSFLMAYPDGALVLKSESGSLSYSYREQRIAFFPPGNVSLVLTSKGVDKKLMTRNLQPNDILTLSVTAPVPDAEKKGIDIAVDTLRNWIDEDFIIGGGNGGGSSRPGPGSGSDGNFPSDVLTVAEAVRSIGKTGVWVHGFIVGGDLTSTSVRYDPPFRSRTNLLLAPRAGACARESCLAVSLPDGIIREALNLTDHPELLGCQVYIKGDLVEPYFRISGLKNVSAYKL